MSFFFQKLHFYFYGKAESRNDCEFAYQAGISPRCRG